MNPCWIITEDGAFICGDFDSCVTSYSYPTPERAIHALLFENGASFIIITPEG